MTSNLWAPVSSRATPFGVNWCYRRLERADLYPGRRRIQAHYNSWGGVGTLQYVIQ